METSEFGPEGAVAPADRPSVRISSRPGAIRIDAPLLFGGNDESAIHRLVERLLSVSAVETVDIDDSAGKIALRYDRRSLGHREALSTIAAALRDEPPRRIGGEPANVDLGRIVGKVVRIERRNLRGGVMTTVLSAGADFLTAIAPGIGPAHRRPLPPNRCHGERVLFRDGLAIHYRPDAAGGATGRALLPAEINTRLTLVGNTVADQVARPAIVVARGWRRVAHLTAAGGCFFMSFVGLVTPGIPTVPFVLATSYFLVRSSPALDERLRRSRLFGQMVRDWTAYKGMRPGTKRRVVYLTLAIMAGTLLFVEPTGPILMLMGVMGTLGVTLILWTRTVPEDAPDDTTVLISQ